MREAQTVRMVCERREQEAHTEAGRSIVRVVLITVLIELRDGCDGTDWVLGR